MNTIYIFNKIVSIYYNVDIAVDAAFYTVVFFTFFILSLVYFNEIFIFIKL